MQRTRVYQSDREIQPGLLIGFSWENLDVTAYVLNPDEDNPIFVFAIGVKF